VFGYLGLVGPKYKGFETQGLRLGWSSRGAPWEAAGRRVPTTRSPLATIPTLQTGCVNVGIYEHDERVSLSLLMDPRLMVLVEEVDVRLRYTPTRQHHTQKITGAFTGQRPAARLPQKIPLSGHRSSGRDVSG